MLLLTKPMLTRIKLEQLVSELAAVRPEAVLAVLAHTKEAAHIGGQVR